MNSSPSLTAHRLRSGTVVRSVVAASLLAAAGLCYLYLKHQLYVAGSRKRALETEMRDLSQRGRVLETQIAELTSRTALQGRLKDGFIRMVDIPAPAIVHVRLLPEGASGGLASADSGPAAVGDGALRPISHEGSSRTSGPRTARQ